MRKMNVSITAVLLVILFATKRTATAQGPVLQAERLDNVSGFRMYSGWEMLAIAAFPNTAAEIEYTSHPLVGRQWTRFVSGPEESVKAFTWYNGPEANLTIDDAKYRYPINSQHPRIGSWAESGIKDIFSVTSFGYMPSDQLPNPKPRVPVQAAMLVTRVNAVLKELSTEDQEITIAPHSKMMFVAAFPNRARARLQFKATRSGKTLGFWNELEGSTGDYYPPYLFKNDSDNPTVITISTFLYSNAGEWQKAQSLKYSAIPSGELVVYMGGNGKNDAVLMAVRTDFAPGGGIHAPESPRNSGIDRPEPPRR